MITWCARLEPADEGGFVVTFPDFGWGVTQAADEAGALSMAADLLVSLIASDIRDGKDLPRPVLRRHRNCRPVTLSGLASAKIELYRAFRASGLSKSELARRTGIARTNIDRLFDLRHAGRLDQIEAAFRALGLRLQITVEAA